MNFESHKKFIKESHEEYKKIGYVVCPAFNNERIYFNKKGFRHLIWKGTKLRDVSDQVKRITFLKYAPRILSSSYSFKDFDKNKYDNPSVHFWSFIKIINSIKIVVLIRQVKDGPKHFYSIMERDEKHKAPRKGL